MNTTSTNGLGLRPEFIKSIIGGISLDDLNQMLKRIYARRNTAFIHNLPGRFAYPSDLFAEQKMYALSLAYDLKRGNTDIFLQQVWSDIDALSDKWKFLSYLLPIEVVRATPVLWQYDLLVASQCGREIFVGQQWDDTTLIDPASQLWVPDRDIIPTLEYKKEFKFPHPELEWIQNWMLIVNFSHPAIRDSIPRLPDNLRDTLQGICGKQPENLIEVISHFSLSDENIKNNGGIEAIGSNNTSRIMTGLIPMDKPLSDSASAIYASARFMNQKITEVTQSKLERVERRRLRKNSEAQKWKINVISLRRKTVDSSTHHTGNRDFSCRWMVRGHWRNQYHPSTGEHYPTFINEYVKGPEDKPFALGPKIYKVVR